MSTISNVILSFEHNTCHYVINSQDIDHTRRNLTDRPYARSFFVCKADAAGSSISPVALCVLQEQLTSWQRFCNRYSHRYTDLTGQNRLFLDTRKLFVLHKSSSGHRAHFTRGDFTSRLRNVYRIFHECVMNVQDALRIDRPREMQILQLFQTATIQQSVSLMEGPVRIIENAFAFDDREVLITLMKYYIPFERVHRGFMPFHNQLFKNFVSLNSQETDLSREISSLSTTLIGRLACTFVDDAIIENRLDLIDALHKCAPDILKRLLSLPTTGRIPLQVAIGRTDMAAIKKIHEVSTPEDFAAMLRSRPVPRARTLGEMIEAIDLVKISGRPAASESHANSPTQEAVDEVKELCRNAIKLST